MEPYLTGCYRRRKVPKSVWAMASAEARAYNGGLGRSPSGGPGGRAPGGGPAGQSPPEAEAFLAFWTSNGCNKFAPFAVLLVSSRFKKPAIEQVAQLSLTNPRDTLHHEKRQILNQSRDHNHTLLLVICHPVVRINKCKKLSFYNNV